MSCDITKLEYLDETKQLIRQAIDPDGTKISDSTPFRNYAELISGGGTSTGIPFPTVATFTAMADDTSIEKTTVKGDTFSETVTNIYNYLLANAVPKYFDSVRLTSNIVECFIGNNLFLTLSCTNTNRGDIKYYNGSLSYYLSTTESTYFYNYAWKCEGGISFSLSNDPNTPVLTIAKDNAENTVVIFPKSGNLTLSKKTGTRDEMYAISYAAADLSALPPVQRGIFFAESAITSFVPFVVNGCSTYTKNVFIMPTYQYLNAGVLDIGGVKYLSNGLWCVKK